MFLDLSLLNKQAFVFSIISLSFLTVIRFSNLILFNDPQALQNSLPLLDDLFITGLRFDVKLTATILLAFIYIPSLFLSIDEFEGNTAPNNTFIENPPHVIFIRMEG